MAVTFKATLHKFDKKGEKTGWTFIDIGEDIIGQLKPGYKKSFRVKGRIDEYAFKGLSLLPMGEGDFIMTVNGVMRKKIRKKEGDTVLVELSEDKAPVKISEDLLACLVEDKKAKEFFESLPGSHRNYFSKWIESAKTPETKARRIAQSVSAFQNKQGYAEMMRANKAAKSSL